MNLFAGLAGEQADILLTEILVSSVSANRLIFREEKMKLSEALKNKENFIDSEADIIVVGAGHAGIEAALVGAKKNHSCILFYFKY